MSVLLTEHEFGMQQATVDVPDNALNGTLTGIVTYIKTDDGYYVLSRYEDDVWQFPKKEGTAATIDSKRKLNFGKIKEIEYRRMAKWVIINLMKEGRALGTLQNKLNMMCSYFRWVDQFDVVKQSGLNAFTSNKYVEYVNSLTSNHGKRKGKPLSASAKTLRFLAPEILYRYCNYFDFVKEHPWIGSSALEQAGNVGQAYIDNQNIPKTEIIHDEVLKLVCEFTKGYLDRAGELLSYKEKLYAFIPTTKNSQGKRIQKEKYLQSLGYKGSLGEFNNELLILRDSCFYWILLTTGMRIHEVLGIKRGVGVGYKSETIDDIKFYYVKSISEKTGEGKADWVAPKIAIDGIKILERYSSALQKELKMRLRKAEKDNDVEEKERLTEIDGAIGLSVSSSQSKQINILSGNAINQKRLSKLFRLAGADWNPTPHQFRRTFANHAVHSDIGDLRALKEHFKHWTLSMTALYAANPDLDKEMIEEVMRERYFVEEQIKEDLFSLENPLAGGRVAQKSLEFRDNSELLKTYTSRSEMVKSFTSTVSFKATGVGWCTNDDGVCMKNCADCDSCIVDGSHIEHWKSMYIQQLELQKTVADDIGTSGQEAVRLGLEQYEKILTDLGVDVESIKREFQDNDKVVV